MSGSLPHSIALANHTSTGAVTPGYTTYDIRSDEDTNLSALNARNAKASSDLIVTISEQAQALSQQNKKKSDKIEEKDEHALLMELMEEEFIEEEPVISAHATSKESKVNIYHEAPHTGDNLDQIV